MAVEVDVIIQDANKLLSSTKKHAEALVTVGVTAGTVQNFESTLQDLVQKDSVSKESENLKRAKKNEQDEQISRSQSAIWKFRETAKIPFRNDKGVLKDFHIGIAIPKNVRSLITELAYMKEVGTRHFDTLKNYGVSEADLSNLVACKDALMAVDSAQEGSKDTRKGATAARDLVVNTLKDMMAMIRQSADVCFANDPAIRDEFKTIIVHRKKKATDTGTESGTTTETPTAS